MKSAATNSSTGGKAAPCVGTAAGGARRAAGADAMEDMVALTLDDRGMIRDCNRAGESLFNYRRSELVWRHVSMLLPQLADLELIQHGQINQRLRFHCRIGRYFEALTRDGERFASDLFLNLVHNTGGAQLLLLVRPANSK